MKAKLQGTTVGTYGIEMKKEKKHVKGIHGAWETMAGVETRQKRTS